MKEEEFKKGLHRYWNYASKLRALEEKEKARERAVEAFKRKPYYLKDKEQ